MEIILGGIALLSVIFAFVSFRQRGNREKEIEGAKTEFVSLISHQLRTPPSTIKWYAEMLQNEEKGPLTDDQKKYVNQIYTSSQQMISLTNALLNVSRLELGTFAIEPEEVDLIKIVKQVLDEYKPQILVKKLQIKEEYEENMPHVTTDPKFITIVLRNLLSNAILYNPDNGQVTIAITKDTNNKIRIRITDTGYGIPKGQQGKVFTKLFRADNAKMLGSKGSGLGLYVVKSIINQMGGKIWFESEQDKGATFYVSLPQVSIQKRREGARLD
jgi:signal transduction histidine kinase